MKKRMAYIIIVATVVLLGTCFDSGNSLTQPTLVYSQDSDGADFLIWQRNFGITPTQMFRVTVANRSTGRNAQPLSFQVTIRDQNGVRVFQTARREVPPQGFRSENIKYGDLAAATGDPATLRKQINVVLSGFQSGGGFQSTGFGSLEIMDVDSGKTTILLDVNWDIAEYRAGDAGNQDF